MFGTMEFYFSKFFPSYWEFHHPNWRSHIFQRGWLKPPTRKDWGNNWAVNRKNPWKVCKVRCLGEQKVKQRRTFGSWVRLERERLRNLVGLKVNGHIKPPPFLLGKNACSFVNQYLCWSKPLFSLVKAAFLIQFSVGKTTEFVWVKPLRSPTGSLQGLSPPTSPTMRKSFLTPPSRRKQRDVFFSSGLPPRCKLTVRCFFFSGLPGPSM